MTLAQQADDRKFNRRAFSDYDFLDIRSYTISKGLNVRHIFSKSTGDGVL